VIGLGDKTRQIEATIRGWVDTGELPPGAILPSERALAQEFGAGRTTIRLVLIKLTSQGIVRAEHGRGYFVCAADGRSAGRAAGD
jgi:GntR family transcriptional regulator